MRLRSKTVAGSLFAVLILIPYCLAAADQPSIEAEADGLLKKMSAYLATLDVFTVLIESTQEELLDSGQKLMFTLQSEITIKRPDKYHASRKGMIRNQEFFYDGKHLVLYGKTDKLFARVPAPATNDEALTFATDTLGLTAPAADLMYSDTYSGLMEDALEGYYIGPTIVAGKACHHLAYRNGEVDWQIWILDGDKPLPLKYVITSKWLTAAPQHTMTFLNWDTETAVSDDKFQFNPTEGATEIEFLKMQSTEEEAK